jgi:hypothetical protein
MRERTVSRTPARSRTEPDGVHSRSDSALRPPSPGDRRGHVSVAGSTCPAQVRTVSRATPAPGRTPSLAAAARASGAAAARSHRRRRAARWRRSPRGSGAHRGSGASPAGIGEPGGRPREVGRPARPARRSRGPRESGRRATPRLRRDMRHCHRPSLARCVGRRRPVASLETVSPSSSLRASRTSARRSCSATRLPEPPARAPRPR